MGKFSKIIAVSAAGFALTAAAANAACTKPVGRYVGSGSGMAYNMGDGSMYQAAAMSLSVNILNDGSASATEMGKTFTSGPYTMSWSVPSTKNSFNATTCQGTLITSFGKKYTYTSSNSGNSIEFIYTTNDSIFAMYSIRLQKV